MSGSIRNKITRRFDGLQKVKKPCIPQSSTFPKFASDEVTSRAGVLPEDLWKTNFRAMVAEIPLLPSVQETGASSDNAGRDVVVHSGCTQGLGAAQGHRSGVEAASQKTTAMHDQATGPGGQSVLDFPDGTTGQRVRKH